MDERIKLFGEKMEKSFSNMIEEFGTIRVGRANPKVISKITVDYYGTQTPIQQVGNISVPEPRILQIQPWESNMIKTIEKAIQKSDLGINPTDDGQTIRLVFPELTEDRRKELAKDVQKRSEGVKVTIRNARRDGNDEFKKLRKDSQISEDDEKDFQAELQKLTDKYIAKVDQVAEDKKKEIMTV